MTLFCKVATSIKAVEKVSGVGTRILRETVSNPPRLLVLVTSESVKLRPEHCLNPGANRRPDNDPELVNFTELTAYIFAAYTAWSDLDNLNIRGVTRRGPYRRKFTFSSYTPKSQVHSILSGLYGLTLGIWSEIKIRRFGQNTKITQSQSHPNLVSSETVEDKSIANNMFRL